MKGIIFREFLDAADEAFGEQKTDRLLEACPVASGGVYTSIGSYDPDEMHTLVRGLSEQTAISAENLQRSFGRRLFSRFYDLYPALFGDLIDPLDFLAGIETQIHAEVCKLYPDAELPLLDALEQEPGRLVLRYRSPRRLEHFCLGLIEGCLSFFGEEGEVRMRPGEDDAGVFHDFEILARGRAAA